MSEKRGNALGDVFRIRIELDDVDPLIWRRIELPVSATFWDLHCAIQDSMGWLDCHLHDFDVEGTRIGVSDPEEDDALLPEWEIPLAKYLDQVHTFAYTYDFGDGWGHLVRVEGIHRSTALGTRCIAGENACPPEDCGGPYGYAELTEALSNPRSKSYRELREWLDGGHRKGYWPFDPKAFDESTVVFRDPNEALFIRLKGLDS